MTSRVESSLPTTVSGLDKGGNVRPNIARLKQTMTLDLSETPSLPSPLKSLAGTGLTPYLISPNSDGMKTILGLNQGGNVTAATLVISPGLAALKGTGTPQSATTPQTPMSFLHPKMPIPAEAELFVQEFEKTNRQLFVKREQEALAKAIHLPSTEMMDISYSGDTGTELPVTSAAVSGTDTLPLTCPSGGFLASMTQQTPVSGSVPLLLQAATPASTSSSVPATVSTVNSTSASDPFYYNPHSVGMDSSGENDSCHSGGGAAASSSGHSLHPEHQDKLKLERKRARNRDAARKCRQRKLDRIQHLESKVSDLKENNAKLVQNATDLKKQVADLKAMILQHVQMGCKVHEHNLLKS